MAMAPRVDVSETDTELKIEAELPGIDEKDVEVVLSDGRLTIKGEKKQEKEEKKKDYHMVERSYGSFARSIVLPFEADPDKVKATFAKGVLTVTVPKPPRGQGQGEEDRGRQRLTRSESGRTPARPFRYGSAGNWTTPRHAASECSRRRTSIFGLLP